MLVNTIDGNSQTLKESDWIEDISLMYVGRTQTLAPPSVYIGSDLDHSLQMTFPDDLQINPHVHDPNFFELGPNPLTMPKISTTVDSKFGQKLFYIKLVEHVNNQSMCGRSVLQLHCLHQEQCLPEEGLQTSLGQAELIGRLCEDREQFDQDERELYKFNTLEQKDISNTTGCLLLWQYREYQTV